jgi:hypothetical protein
MDIAYMIHVKMDNTNAGYMDYLRLMSVYTASIN